jgi:hypothetical protein
MRERFKGQHVLLARSAASLSVSNADRGVRGNTAAVGDENDDITRPVVDRPDREARGQRRLTLLEKISPS